MKKRIVFNLFLAVLLAGIGLSVGAKPAAPETTRWKVGIVSAEGTYGTKTLKWWADEVTKRTNGLLKIEAYIGGSSPYKPGESLKSLRENLMEGAEVWGWGVGGEVPEIKVIDLPGFISGGLVFREKVARDFESDMATILAKHNAYLYGFAQSSPRNVYIKKPANSLAEIKGRKLRAAGKEEQELTNSMEAVGTVMPGPEIYSALQHGVIDGVWHIDDSVLSNKWYEVLKYIVKLDWGGSGVYFCLNKTALDALPKDVRKVVIDLQPNFRDKMFEYLATATTDSRAILLNKGMKEIPWPTPDMDKMTKLSKTVARDWYQAAPPEARKLHDKIEAYIIKAGYR